jgi:hypothetical protein
MTRIGTALMTRIEYYTNDTNRIKGPALTTQIIEGYCTNDADRVLH